MPIIRQSIRPGTHIMSDEWRAYLFGIPRMLNVFNQPLYMHTVVNHSQNFVNPADGTHTQNVESLWCKAKARNKRHWGTARTLLDSYLCEFMWRRRLNGRDPFDEIIQDIVLFMPPV